MGIEKLDGNVIGIIGAAQVLADSAALIKELIDNSLDAHATSIAVEISSNTLDVIQVRDNGHGVAPEDRELVAKPNCTSKLAHIDDLKQLGGSSLGFRGQALASAAEMSGSLTISTRVEGEQVAAALKINQAGEVVGKESASMPVGSTIKVTDFARAHPVRRQVALKNIERCLKKIKQLMQAYAFARPSVRLSLRVLKAKNDRSNWTYAPKPGGNVEDAAYKIVGAACASQCTWSVIEHSGFTLQALLPRHDADEPKISNIGAFISIDGRPVSSGRGTLKLVMKVFRGALRAANTAFDGVKEPFIYMDVICPPASYDPNVEPAKDDVLFEDPDLIVDAARKLFAAVYSTEQTAKADAINRSALSSSLGPPMMDLADDSLMTTMEASHPHNGVRGSLQQNKLATPLPSSSALHDDGRNDVPGRQLRSFRPNMYGCDEEDLELVDARSQTGRIEADLEEMRRAREDVTVSNPWVMAKMHASQKYQIEGLDDGRNRPPVDLSCTSSSIPRSLQAAPTLPHGLLTPRPSSPVQPAKLFHLSDHVSDVRPLEDGRLIGSSCLPPPIRLGLPPIDHIPPSLRHERDQEVARTLQGPANNFMVPARADEMLAGTPLDAIPNASERPRRNPRKHLQQAHINRPFVSPLHNHTPPEKVWFDHLDDKGMQQTKKRRPRQFQNTNSSGLVSQGELGDLVDEPRPLTPPRHNHDIRDFVEFVDRSRVDTPALLVESRNYGRKTRRQSADAGAVEVNDGEENAAPQINERRIEGFVSASEMLAMDTLPTILGKATTRPQKRRDAGISRVLRQISGNIGEHSAEEDEYSPGKPQSLSRRRRTTDGDGGKIRRIKSSQLPLERIPRGQGTHDLLHSQSVTTSDIARLASMIDEEHCLLEWSEPALEPSSTVASSLDESELHCITTRLHELLLTRVSDGEMVQDLGLLVRNVFARDRVQEMLLDAMSVA